MKKEIVSAEKGGALNLIESDPRDPLYVEMEMEENAIDCRLNEIQGFASSKGEGTSVVFSTEEPLVMKDSRINTGSSCSCNARKLKSSVAATDSFLLGKDKSGLEKRLSRHDRIELGRLFQGAVSSYDWDLAESLITVADPQALNDALCITLDSIWFLSTQQELSGITGLIKKIIANGAYDFTRAALRTSFLASCVSACHSRTMSPADTVTVMAQR